MGPSDIQPVAPSGERLVSFRDPSGQLVVSRNRVFRLVTDDAWDSTDRFLSTPLSKQLIGEGKLIETERIDPQAIQIILNGDSEHSPYSKVLEHRLIGFASYPYEWPPEMLLAAGELTLELMERLLADGFGLKDASAYNILFDGPRPVFVDLLSIEQRNQLDPTWMAYAQFIRNFIRPLLAIKHFGLGLDQTFRVYRDGLQPEHLFRMSSFSQKLRPQFLTSVSFPALLSRMQPERYEKIYESRLSSSSEQAHFILHRQIRGLHRKLRATAPDPNRKSTWTNYETSDNREKSYIPDKDSFVREVFHLARPKRVLDVGCNEGHFSLLAARSGCSVVSIDQDVAVVGSLWRQADREQVNILPLVVDITRPTAGLGWRNRETRGFLDRAIGTFDCVLMLAVIHHMLVTERIPLREILQLAWELTTDRLIIEWVDPADSMFRLLTRGNQKLYEHLSRESFERIAGSYFSFESKQVLSGETRTLYVMRRREQIVHLN